MRRARIAVVALMTGPAVGIGCNAFVGNADHELEGILPDATTESDGANGMNEGSFSGDGTSDGGTAGDSSSATDTLNAGDGLNRDSGVCSQGSTQCSGSTTQLCDRTGHWVDGIVCPYVCSLGQCTGACVPSSIQPCGDAGSCNSGAVQTCDSTGAWGTCTPGPGTCVPVPSGWVPVAQAGSDAGCPSGYTLPQTYAANPDGGAPTCACNCQGTQACGGTAILNDYAPDAGCAGPPQFQATLNLTATCGAGVSLGILLGDGYTVSDASIAPTPSCNATPQTTGVPALTTDSVVVCQAAATCPAGACLSGSEAASMCVAALGTNPCPPGFPTRTVIALDVSDTRGCGPCACGSTLTCALTGVLLDNDSPPTCGTSNPYNFTWTSGCTPGPSSYPLNGTKGIIAVGGDGGCVQTAPSLAEGGVALDPTTTSTLCCP